MARRNEDIFGVGSMFSQGSKPKRDKRRAFTRTQKNEILAQQNNKCAKCHKPLDMRTVEFDHKKGWADRGRTVTQNGQALCPHCHKLKTHKSRLKKIEKKRKPKKESIFGGSLFGEQPKRRKKKSDKLFDFGF